MRVPSSHIEYLSVYFNQLYRFVALLLVSICYVSCTSTELNIKDYQDYVHHPKNGLTVTKQSDNWTYSLQYRPQEAMAIIELQGDNFNEENFRDVLKSYQYFEYYLLSLKNINTDKNDIKLSESILVEYNFNWKENLKLVINEDTILPKMYHFEHFGKLNKELRFLMAYDTMEISDRKFLIGKHDEDEIISLNISKEDIQNLPAVKI